MMAFLALGMDVIVIALLGATVFYAMRLSKQLHAFRQTKGDLQHLIGDLSGQITQAEMAITGLREAARESGRDLQELISEGNALKDELEMMHDSANRLAGRLEDAATRNSSARNTVRRKATVQSPRPAAPVKPPFEIKDPDEWDMDIEEGIESEDEAEEEGGIEASVSRSAAPGRGQDESFMIRDPEFDADESGDARADSDMSGGAFEEELEEFQSRAEKELFAALRGKKKLKTAGDA